jgi:hypothetical protein
MDKARNLRITSLFTLRRQQGGSASATALVSAPLLRHILPALVFAAQSPYSGRPNAVNSRNIMRNTARNWLNKEFPEQSPGYLRFLLEIFAYAGEQIPHTPSFPQQAAGY